jgi:hypothetical protein
LPPENFTEPLLWLNVEAVAISKTFVFDVVLLVNKPVVEVNVPPFKSNNELMVIAESPPANVPPFCVQDPEPIVIVFPEACVIVPV